jgi:hypothetical protein
MKSFSRVTGLLLAFLVGIGVGASGLWLIVQNSVELRYYLLEHATGNQPQAQIAAFVQAIVRSDHSTALELWEVGDPNTQSELASRQESVISDLVAAGIGADYMILGIEWWTTCCEPSVTCDSRSAGGARIRVQFLDKNGRPIQYIFDVFAREQPYFGSAAGYPARDWVIRDVYPSGQEPLFWAQVYEPQIRLVQP